MNNSNPWYKAVNLQERAQILSKNLQKLESDHFDRAVSEERYNEWTNKRAFHDDARLKRRVSALNLSIEDFIKLLGIEPEFFAQNTEKEPSWLSFLNKSFESYFSSNGDETNSVNNQKSFGVVVEPLVQTGIKTLVVEIGKLNKKYPHISLDQNKIITHFFNSLGPRLMTVIHRTLILELHVAKLEGYLNGNTPEKRFEHFINLLKTPEKFSSILEEYPVLGQQCSLFVIQWVGFVTEFLTHLCEDWYDICSTFEQESLGQLEFVSASLGDTHNQGKFVVSLKFESGLRLIYKPHSLNVDVHFNGLLEWLNQHSADPDFYITKVLGKKAHGWVEFIEYKECKSIEELQRFYTRQGSYLALMYALESTDFHSENLIAHGEYPVLVDLETLFHGRIKISEQLDPGSKLMQDSVLRVGLLPEKIVFRAKDSGAVDLSGLGGDEGQLTPNAVLTWQESATDDIHIVRKKFSMPRASNLPYSKESRTKAKDYVEEIVSGFSSTYSQLVKYRDDLVSNGGILEIFSNDEVRIVCRPSHQYGNMLGESYHPDFLRDALDRDLLFEGLWGASGYLPDGIILAEQRDLWMGDIPVFHSTPISSNVYSSDGANIDSFLEKSGLESAKEKIQRFDSSDLQRQLWFIKASMTSQSSQSKISEKKKNFKPKKFENINLSENLLVEAGKIADRIESLALRDHKTVSWVGVSLADDKSWRLSVLGNELYEGTSGIALFLTYIGVLTNNERYTTLAKDIIAGISIAIEPVQELDKLKNHDLSVPIGGYHGIGSIIYALAHMGSLLEQDYLIDQAKILVSLLPPLIEKDTSLDIIGGTAGCLGALTSLYRMHPTDDVLAVARLCGEKLVSCAKTMETGYAWDTTEDCSQPLTGFSHGAAGISWALLELFEITKDDSFKSYAKGAIDYENSNYLEKYQNWADLRTSGSEEKIDYVSVTAWCHGAPGIGLARARAIEILDSDETSHIYRDLEIALETTKRDGFSYGHSLCHGDLGNLDLFLKGGPLIDDKRWKKELIKKTHEVLHSGKEFGWLSGTPNFVETPGLMVGLSGIGYQLLRLALPDQVPSVLLLEPLRFNG